MDVGRTLLADDRTGVDRKFTVREGGFDTAEALRVEHVGGAALRDAHVDHFEINGAEVGPHGVRVPPGEEYLLLGLTTRIKEVALFREAGRELLPDRRERVVPDAQGDVGRIAQDRPTHRVVLRKEVKDTVFDDRGEQIEVPVIEFDLLMGGRDVRRTGARPLRARVRLRHGSDRIARI
ncbi:Uncharacterised protein [Chlamydia trachomatis]|nr:Uncharacterised protein [Chlamydia trachomatis]